MRRSNQVICAIMALSCALSSTSAQATDDVPRELEPLRLESSAVSLGAGGSGHGRTLAFAAVGALAGTMAALVITRNDDDWEPISTPGRDDLTRQLGALMLIPAGALLGVVVAKLTDGQRHYYELPLRPALGYDAGRREWGASISGDF